MLDSYGEAKFVLRYLREVPLAWFVLGLGIAKLVIFPAAGLSAKSQSIWLRRCAFACGVLVLCAYVAISLDSLRCFMIQQDEANIISISAASLRGLPMYHLPASPRLSYSLMYGPFTFLIYSFALVGGGISHFWVMRGVVVLAALVLCWVLYSLLRRFVPNPVAVALLAFPLSVFLQHCEFFLSLRADIWIVLFAALALKASFFETESAAVLIAGICGGLIVGLKITAVAAILLPFLILYRRFGRRAPVYSLLAMSAVTLAPFVFPNVSLRNYIAWILFTRTEGLSAVSMSYNLLFALFLISPILIMELYMRRFGLSFRQRTLDFLIIVLCLVIGVFTSKNGSGVYYLWHIVPSVVVYMALVARDISEVQDEQRWVPIYCVAVACTLFAGAYVPRALGYLRLSKMPPAVAAARKSLDEYLDLYRNRSSVQMGYGSVDGDYRTLLRYVMVYRGQPYTFEGNTARFETRILPFPQDVLRQMRSCKDDVWLVPHSQHPFELWVFRDDLHKAFVQNYRIEQTDGIFDVWACKRTEELPAT